MLIKQQQLSMFVSVIAAPWESIGKAIEQRKSWERFPFDSRLSGPFAVCMTKVPALFAPWFALALCIWSAHQPNIHASSRNQSADTEAALASPPDSIPLRASRNGTDPDPRDYTKFFHARDINKKYLRQHIATDGAGIPLVGIVDDQSGKNAEFIPAVGFAQPLTAVKKGSAWVLLDPRKNTQSLAADFSAPLEYQLSQAPPSGLLASGLFEALNPSNRGKLSLLEPYRPGAIPVVLIHGLNSEAQTWMNFYNELQADPLIRSKYQFLLFRYPSGEHALFNAADLRDSLHDFVRFADPNGKDPAVRNMVLIGHSMGGILARLMVTKSNDDFWHLLARKSPKEIRWDKGTIEKVSRLTFFEPLPFVKRAIFIATPHRGSAMATGLPGRIARRLIYVPGDMVQLSTNIATLDPVGVQQALIGSRVPTSIDTLTPNRPFVKVIQDKPIAVPVHTLIGTGGRGGNSDGIVPVASSRIDSAVSELLIDSKHNVHNHPDAPPEVARILREHLKSGKAKSKTNTRVPR